MTTANAAPTPDVMLAKLRAYIQSRISDEVLGTGGEVGERECELDTIAALLDLAAGWLLPRVGRANGNFKVNECAPDARVGLHDAALRILHVAAERLGVGT